MRRHGRRRRAARGASTTAAGPALYAGGDFTTAGGVEREAHREVERLELVGARQRDATRRRVVALAVFDDGSGRALYAGGEFTTAGGVSAQPHREVGRHELVARSAAAASTTPCRRARGVRRRQRARALRRRRVHHRGRRRPRTASRSGTARAGRRSAAASTAATSRTRSRSFDDGADGARGPLRRRRVHARPAADRLARHRASGTAASRASPYCFGDGLDPVVDRRVSVRQLRRAGTRLRELQRVARRRAPVRVGHDESEHDRAARASDDRRTTRCARSCAASNNDPRGVVFGDGVRCVERAALALRPAELGTEAATRRSPSRSPAPTEIPGEHLPLRRAVPQSDRRLLHARALQRVERVHDRVVSARSRSARRWRGGDRTGRRDSAERTHRHAAEVLTRATTASSFGARRACAHRRRGIAVPLAMLDWDDALSRSTAPSGSRPRGTCSTTARSGAVRRRDLHVRRHDCRDRVAKWNGASGRRSARHRRVRDALAVFDDGSGPALYAGGHFTALGGARRANASRSGTARAGRAAPARGRQRRTRARALDRVRRRHGTGALRRRTFTSRAACARTASRSGTARAGRARQRRRTATVLRARACSTTERDPRSTSAARSRPPAASARTASRSGTERAGRALGERHRTARCYALDACSTTARARRSTPAAFTTPAERPRTASRSGTVRTGRALGAGMDSTCSRSRRSTTEPAPRSTPAASSRGGRRRAPTSRSGTARAGRRSARANDVVRARRVRRRLRSGALRRRRSSRGGRGGANRVAKWDGATWSRLGGS